MPIFTNPQISTLQRVAAAMNNVLPRLEAMERLGELNSGLAQRMRELRAQREYLTQFAMSALEINRQLEQPVSPPPALGYSPPSPPPPLLPPPPPPAGVPSDWIEWIVNNPTTDQDLQRTAILTSTIKFDPASRRYYHARRTSNIDPLTGMPRQ